MAGKLVLALLLVLLVGFGAWGWGWSLEGGRPPRSGAPPQNLHVSPLSAFSILPGIPRELPVRHGDFELQARVVVPPGETLDLVFRLQPGPGPATGDQTSPGPPLEWSFLRLSAGDLGPAFYTSRELPEKAGGHRVGPGIPTDLKLRVCGSRAVAEVGHEALAETGVAHAREGILAFVGAGRVETLSVVALPPRLRPGTLGLGLGLALAATALGGLLGLLLKRPGGGGLLGAAVAAAAGLWAMSPPGWSREIGTPPAFRQATELYGAPDGFRNWGAFAGSLAWRGRIECRTARMPARRVAVLGDAQTWGEGVAEKSATFALQAEGLLARRLAGGTAPVQLLVAACRTTDLDRQLRVFQEDMAGFRPQGVLLVCPSAELRRPDRAAAGIAAFHEELAREGLFLAVLPPLAPPDAPGWRELRQRLLNLRGKGVLVGDPESLLRDTPGCFRPGPEGSLGLPGHLGLGALVAGLLESALLAD